MDVEEELTTQTTPTIPSRQSPEARQSLASPSTQQASQLQAELTQRGDKAMKREEETATNHRGEVFKQNKPTITEQIHHISPPRTFTPIKPEMYSIIATDDEDMASNINRAIASSSTQAPAQAMKRSSPETEIEPKGKRGGHKQTEAMNKRATPAVITVETMGKDGKPRLKTGKGEKRDGEMPEDETDRKAKRSNKNKEKIQKRLEAKIQKEQEAMNPDEEREELKPTKGSKKVRSSIHKPQIPSNIFIQELRNEFENANNKNIITKEKYNEFQEIFNEWKKSKRKKKKNNLG